MALTCYIFEGTWWNHKEVPQVLPYFQALASTDRRLKLSHRSIKDIDDIRFWISKIPKNEQAFVYFACHGVSQELYPFGNQSKITNEDLLSALGESKENAIDFLHFGCCQMLRRVKKDSSLEGYSLSSNAKWVSGYSKKVGWVQSTLLDLAIVSELAIPAHYASKKSNIKLAYRAANFLKVYGGGFSESLGFAGVYRDSNNNKTFFS